MIQTENPSPWTHGILGITAGIYLLAQLLIRLGAPHGVELDEAEQLLLGQWLQGGYSAQPPLYTWLQILAFRLLQADVGALAVLRTLLLLAFFGLFLLSARLELRDNRLATLAVLSLLFVPQVVWELQRESTHSLLVVTLAAAQLYSLQRLLVGPTLAGYVIAGLIAGLGMLAKYNYGIFLAAAGAALLTSPAGRVLVLDRRLPLAALAALLVMSPHLLWLLDNGARVFESLAVKLDAQTDSGPGIAAGRLALTLVSYLSPLWILYLVLFPRAWGCLLSGRPLVPTRFPFQVYFGLVLGILLLIAPGLDADRFRERWMHPLLFLFPIWFMAHVDLGALNPRRERAFLLAAAGVALLMLGVMAFRSFVAPVTGPHSRIDQPLDLVAQRIRELDVPTARIVAAHYHLAGALRLHFPASQVFAPRPDLAIPAPGPGPALLVWNAAQSEAVPEILSTYMAVHRPDLTLESGAPMYIETPYDGAPGGHYRLGLLGVR